MAKKKGGKTNMKPYYIAGGVLGLLLLIGILVLLLGGSDDGSGGGSGGGGNGGGGNGGGGETTAPTPAPAKVYHCVHNGNKGKRGGCMADPNCMLEKNGCTGTKCTCISRVQGPEVDCGSFTGNEKACKQNQGRCEWSNGYGGEYPTAPGANNQTCMLRSEEPVPDFVFGE